MVLNCKVDSIPFMYIGLPIGGDARKCINSRLSGWSLRYLPLGGRLVLLKFVLSSLPIYVLSSNKDSRLLRFVDSFFATLMVDRSMATSRRLERVMLFMPKCGACILVWTWHGGRTPLIVEGKLQF
uniref:Uncharacterized protein n=1 Tax=Medicago truncatula TaxID=3880 RepID=Q1RU38_MEDTR|nr:hypothetical protein MtrDRAFT_AC153125g4v2 [Medicago truncatula]